MIVMSVGLEELLVDLLAVGFEVVADLDAGARCRAPQQADRDQAVTVGDGDGRPGRVAGDGGDVALGVDVVLARSVSALALLALGLGLPARLVGVVLRPRQGGTGRAAAAGAMRPQLAGLVGEPRRLVDEDRAEAGDVALLLVCAARVDRDEVADVATGLADDRQDARPGGTLALRTVRQGVV